MEDGVVVAPNACGHVAGAAVAYLNVVFVKYLVKPGAMREMFPDKAQERSANAGFHGFAVRRVVP